MAEDSFLPFVEEVSEIGDELKEAYVDDLKTSDPYGFGLPALPSYVLDNIVSRLNDACLIDCMLQGMSMCFKKMQPLLIGKWSVADFIVVSQMVVDALVPVILLSFVYLYLIGYIDRGGSKAGSSGSLDSRDIYISILLFQAAYAWIKFRYAVPVVLLAFVYLYLIDYIDRGDSKAGSSGSLDSRDIYIYILLFQAAYVWVKFRYVVPVVLLSFVYLYLIGYIDRGGSKAGSSGSLDFRDIYISILLFRAAYVWIKFRDVIPRGAVYYRPNSNKFEPRIKFPVTKGKSKRIPLGLYNTFVEGEVAYQIAAFYCDKPKHTGRLDLGGGASFSIPALSVDPNLPYEEKVKQVANQVLKVYAEFEERKASRIVPRSVPRLAFEMPIGEGQLLATSPIEQPRQPLNSGTDSAKQCQGSQLGPDVHNGIDFNNPGCFLPVLAKTQYELLDAHKENKYLKAQMSQMEVENMGLEVKYSELERKYLELELKLSEVERENGLLNHQIMQSQLQALHQGQELDTNIFLSMGQEESLARS